MADVVVTTVNKFGQKASILLDNEIERDAELIESLKRQVRREDLDKIDVKPATAAKRAPRKADAEED